MNSLIGYCYNDLGPTGTWGQQGGGAYMNAPTGPTPKSVYLNLSNVYAPVIYRSDGMQFQFGGTWDTFSNPNGPPLQAWFPYGFPSVIMDKNGNQITTTWNLNPSDDSQDNLDIEDTVGRHVILGVNGIQYPDSNGQPRLISMTESYVPSPSISVGAHGCPATGSILYAGGGEPAPPIGVYQSSFPEDVYVAGIGLVTDTLSIPTDNNLANNRVYSLTYDYLGEISEADYPSGGSTTYSYQTLSTFDPNVNCMVDYREVAQKTVNDNNGNSGTTTYTPYITPTGAGPGGSYANTTMDVLSNAGKLDHHIFGGAPDGQHDLEIDTSDANVQQPLIQVNYTPSSFAPTSVTTKLLDGLGPSTPTTTTSTSYYPMPYGPLLVQNRTTTDYDNSTVLKTEAFSYSSVGSVGGWFIQGLVASDTVSDSRGTWKTSYVYDEFPLSPSNATQHQGGLAGGNLTSLTKWNGASPYTTHLYHDDAGNVTQITDANGNSTFASYVDSFEPSPACPPAPSTGSASAYPSVITNARGQQRTFSFYSCSGLLKQATDANQRTTSMTYDALGRNLTTTYPDTGSTTNTYHDPSPSWFSSAVAMSPSETYYTKTTYDGLAREVVSQIGTDSDPNEVIKTTSYDPNGNVAEVVTGDAADDRPVWDNYDYDVLGRQVEHDDSLWDRAYTNYNANLVDSTDYLGNHTQRTSDALGRLVSVVEPDATTGSPHYVTGYQYDAVGNLWQVDQWGGAVGNPGDRQRTFVYNGLSQLTSGSNPESGTIGYSYDAVGNLHSRTDANHTILYCYDQLNRLLSKSIVDQSCPANAPSANPYATMTYDSGAASQTNLVGRLSSTSGIGSHAHTRLFSYDSVGRTASLQDSFVGDGSSPHTTSITYDLAGDPTTIGYPSSQQITQVWNNHKQLTSVASGTTTYLANTQYDFLGGAISKTYGNGIAEAVQYNPVHQVDSIWVSPSSGQSPAFFRGYCYNGEDYSYACGLDMGNNGNVTQIVGGPNGVKNFTYDSLNRLTSYQEGSNPASGYSLDPWGNMSRVPTGGGQQVTFNSLDRISNALCTGSNGSAYDGAGNLLCDGNPAFTGSVHEYAYSPDNQITSVANGAFVPTRTYTLSAEGERVRKDSAADGSWEEYFLANGEVMSELSSSNTWSDYIYAGGEKMARVDSVAGSVTASHYYVADPLGTAQIEFSSTGQQVWQGDFDPWGQEVDSNTTTNNYKFTGKERDSESGLDYFGARYYASSMGRWTSPDWSSSPSGVPYASLGNPQSLNLYQYVGNNPLGRADADGHCWPICALIPWVANGVATEGAKGFARNVGIGILKGLGSSAVNTARLAAAGPNPGAIVSAIMTPGPKALQPSNTTQAQASVATQIIAPAVVGAAAGPLLGAAAGGEAGVANALPATVARVISADITTTTLAAPGAADAFVTDAAAIQGMNSGQISNFLTIPESPSGFNVIEFPTPDGIASPINRTTPGFIGGGQTAGGAPEYVVPNGPIPPNATTTHVP